MIITLDGPAGAGKSTVARGLARRLGFMFLDTGAMYRAVALAAKRRNHDWNDTAGLARLAESVRIEVDDARVWLDGEDVTTAIRGSEMNDLVRYAADNPGVRARLVALQRRAAEGRNVVTEGRDQGTVVFPDAGLKIFLTAGPEERARRRLADLQARGEQVTLEEVLAKQNTRDEGDRRRDVGPLLAAEDAVEFVTDGLTPEEVVDRLETMARVRIFPEG
jgi:cytidylate kinase